MVLMLTGMHRSGTSALAGALAASGISTGTGLPLLGASDSQPTGHVEAVPFVQLNNRLLAECGASWMGWPADFTATRSTLATGDLAAEAAELVTGVAETDGESWLVKDPRFSLLLPFWKPIFDQAGLTVRLVVCARHPTEVAASLKTRDDMPTAHGLHLWHAYNDMVLADAEDLDLRAHVVLSRDIYTDTERTLAAAADHAGAKSVDASAATAYIRPELRRESSGAADDLAGSLGLGWDHLRHHANSAAPALPEPARFVHGPGMDIGAFAGKWWLALMDERRAARKRAKGTASTDPGQALEACEGQRTVVAHLHFFKNAGTSVERGLQSWFGDSWASYDKPDSGGRMTATELAEFLVDRPEIQAVSSHHLVPPVTVTAEINLLPIIFLRHPIDRIRSAYEFERTQGGVSPSSRAAESSTFAEWIDFHRGRNSTQCRNHQVFSLTTVRNDVNGAPLFKQPLGMHVRSAMATIEALPAFGIVEEYERSWRWLGAWLGAHFEGFSVETVQANTTQGSTTLDDRLEAVQKRLGDAEFERLLEENAADLRLYEWARASFELGIGLDQWTEEPAR